MATNVVENEINSNHVASDHQATECYSVKIMSERWLFESAAHTFTQNCTCISAWIKKGLFKLNAVLLSLITADLTWIISCLSSTELW